MSQISIKVCCYSSGNCIQKGVHIQVLYSSGLAATCWRSQKAVELVMSLYIFIDHTHYSWCCNRRTGTFLIIEGAQELYVLWNSDNPVSSALSGFKEGSSAHRHCQLSTVLGNLSRNYYRVDNHSQQSCLYVTLLARLHCLLYTWVHTLCRKCSWVSMTCRYL